MYFKHFEEHETRSIIFAGQTVDGPPNGQQMGMSLLAGDYEVVAAETIVAVPYFGSTAEELQSVRLRKDDRVYYVSFGSIPASMYHNLPRL